MKRNLALGLGNVLLVSVMTAPVQAAPAVPVLEEMAPSVQNQTPAISGRYENLYWSIVDDVLIVSGSGPMREMPYGEYYPWQSGECRQVRVKKIVIGEGVRSIGQCAFRNMSSWPLSEGIELPESLQAIGDRAFEQAKFNAITFPAGLLSIGARAFWECANLQQVEFTGKTAPEVRDLAFQWGLESRTYIYPEDGSGYDQLDFIPPRKDPVLYSIRADSSSPGGSVTITPDTQVLEGDLVTVTATPLDDYSFTGWTVVSPEEFELENPESARIEFAMPASSVELKANFELKPIEENPKPVLSGIWGNNLSWKIENGVLIISGQGKMEQASSPDRYPWNQASREEKITKIVIEEGVTSVADSAFCFGRYWNVTEIELPQSLKHIENEAFYSCEQIASIVFPENLEYIGYLSFFGSRYSLEEVTFLSLQAPQIESDAFSWVSRIQKIYLPEEGMGYEDLLHLLDLENKAQIKKLYSIHAQAQPASGGTVLAPDGLLKPGDGVILQACPAEGYEFKGWTVDGLPDLASPELARTEVTFNMPESPVTAIAHFEKMTTEEKPGQPSKPTAPSRPSKPSEPQARSMALYRLYNPNSGEHFYTLNAGEKALLVQAGWTDEGIGWQTVRTSSYPVYRLYNPNAGDHHYTMDTAEKEALVTLGWKDEGISFYSDKPHQGSPVYRQYNPNAQMAGAHNYTINRAENDCLASLGWKAEGIAFWAFSQEKA